MVLTDRQKDILSKVVFEYIDRAQPISSRWLEEQYDLEVSPATIRNELLFLSEEGFLEQPYTSAGRVPTDKGYRFFVDEIFGRSGKKDEEFFEQPGASGEETGDRLQFIPHLAPNTLRKGAGFIQVSVKNLAGVSSNLVIAYLSGQNMLWKEGWEGVLQEPEFEEKEDIMKFTKFLGDFERGIKDFKQAHEIEVYIGQENPFSKVKDFSIIASECAFPDEEMGYVAMVGPKRMAYKKNIGLMHSFLHALEQYNE